MHGTTAVVTGATDGLGSAVARLFVREGAHVVAGGEDADALADLEAAVADAAGRVVTRRTDVRDEFDVERLLRVAADHGPVDVVVAAAAVRHGGSGGTSLADESYAAFDDALRANARGVFATVREAVPHLAGDARVLVPVGAADREPADSAYAVSKAAAAAVARGFAADLDRAVGVVDPGVASADLGDGAGVDPAEAAEQVRWAAVEADPGAIDGQVLDRAAWRNATA